MHLIEVHHLGTLKSIPGSYRPIGHILVVYTNYLRREFK